MHEIPVGPVHAGIIEPGHFRFSIVGEKVLRLEQRLGYMHKGIEKALRRHAARRRRTGWPGASPATRPSRTPGPTRWRPKTATGCTIPARAAWLRALLLERERVANHLGDLGALGNDGGLAFGLAQFSRLREDWQRDSAAVFGHRLLMDRIVPGGVAVDPSRAGLADAARAVPRLRQGGRPAARDLRRARRPAGPLPDDRHRHARTGERNSASPGWPRARAGGRATCGVDLPCAPYDGLAVKPALEVRGDVAARVAVRFDELVESLRLIDALIDRLPEGAGVDRADRARRRRCSASAGSRAGAATSWWRSKRMPTDRLLRCHCHDPSWQNWPLLEHAVIGNIVPDFPLINKSFNLSYSGQDL